MLTVILIFLGLFEIMIAGWTVVVICIIGTGHKKAVSLFKIVSFQLLVAALTGNTANHSSQPNQFDSQSSKSQNIVSRHIPIKPFPDCNRYSFPDIDIINLSEFDLSSIWNHIWTELCAGPRGLFLDPDHAVKSQWTIKTPFSWVLISPVQINEDEAIFTRLTSSEKSFHQNKTYIYRLWYKPFYHYQKRNREIVG